MTVIHIDPKQCDFRRLHQGFFGRQRRKLWSLSAETEYSISFNMFRIRMDMQTAFGEPHNKSINMFFDNQDTLHIAANSVFHKRTKHIERIVTISKTT